MRDAPILAPAFCLHCGAIVDAAFQEEQGAHCPQCLSEIVTSTGEDVFISYGSADLALAERMAQTLSKEGIRFWLAPELIQPSESFLEAIALAIPQCRVMLFLLSEASLNSPWVLKEAAMGVSQKKTMLALRLSDVKLTPGWNFMLTDIQWESLGTAPVEKDLQRICKLVRRKLAPSAAIPLVTVSIRTEPLTLRGVDPNAVVYVGPRPYPEGMETRFFGRDLELRYLIDHLRQAAAVLLISPSGAGKSSLLSAGLTPTLRKASHQVFTDARVGRAVPKEFESRYNEIPNIFAFSSMNGLGSLRPVGTHYLTVAQTMAALPPAGDDRLRVLILDQFEEIFTQHRDRFAERLGFVGQLVEAARSNANLRIVFSMRQEYLADFQMLFESAPPDFQPVRFQLRRLEQEGLIEVVRRPAEEFAEYADDALAAIINQLKTVRVRQPDGSTVEKPGEYIELVHLQIVCDRLWRSLPKGLLKITSRDLAEAAEGIAGQAFENFVKNALDLFYNDVVLRVSRSAETERNGGISVDLIKLGCMKFVSPDGTRQSIQEGEQSTGRLPNWVVKQLADLYLLRSENVALERWYELSHDLLADAVARDLDARVRDLLYASERLESELTRLYDVRGKNLSGYFESDPDLLDVSRPYMSQPGLHADEAEFIFRTSIASGMDIEGWSERIRADHPEIHERVLRDSLQAPNPSVRQNTVRVLSAIRDAASSSALIKLAMSDDAGSVRRAAAVGLLDRDDIATYDQIFGKVEEMEHSRDRQRVVSLLLALSDVRPSTNFDRCYRSLPARLRSDVRVRAWRRRFLDALPILPYTFLFPGAFAAVGAMLYKWLPGAFDWALVQGHSSAGMGAFHGFTAGFIWGGLIPVGLALHRLVFWNARCKHSTLRPFGSLVFGLLGGLVASSLVLLIILSVYEIDSLGKMGWLNVTGQSQRYSAQFWQDLFITTRMGWAHLILGTSLGLGMALTTNRLRASGRWDKFLSGVSTPTSMKAVRRLVRDISSLVLREVWPLPLMLAIGGVFVYMLAIPGIHATAQKQNVWTGIIGDASAQAVGGICAVIGLGAVIVVLRRGFQILPRSNGN